MQTLRDVAVQAWIYIRRRRYRYEHRLAQRKLRHAWKRLEEDVLSRASTQERGYVLPEHHEAIRILRYLEAEMEEDCLLYLGD